MLITDAAANIYQRRRAAANLPCNDRLEQVPMKSKKSLLSMRAIVAALATYAMSTSFTCAETSSDYAGIKTVAVVSSLGTLHLEETGWTVFDLKNEPVPTDSWEIDQRVRKIVEGDLAPRFQVVTAPVSTDALSDCADAESCAAKLPKSSQVDAYILIFKGISFGFSQRDRWSGIGLFHVPGPFNRFKAVAHVIYGIAVIDAKSGNVISQEGGRLPETVFGGEHAQPVQELDASVWPDDASSMNDSQKLAVQSAVFELLDQSLPYTLDQLHLTAH